MTDASNVASISRAPHRFREDGSPVYADALKVKPDLRLPALLAGEVQLAEHPNVVFKLLLALVDPRAYRLVSFAIEAVDGVVASDLHKISLPKLLHTLASADPFVAIGASDEEVPSRIAMSTDEGWKAWRQRAIAEAGVSGPSSEVLLWVARVYAWYRAVGGNPAAAVSETLGVAPRTATRWISRARAEGLLD